MVSWQENGGSSELMTQCVPDLQLVMLDLAIDNTSLSPETPAAQRWGEAAGAGESL